MRRRHRRPLSLAPHIAVVDDEVDITRLLAGYLERQGFRVTQLHAGRALLDLMPTDPPALVLLDLGLPGEDGFTIARELRAHWHCGLVIVTGRGDSVDKIVGLEIGADDYVTKPFSPRELLARIKAVLRRVGEGGSRVRAPDTDNYGFDDWVLRSGERELVDRDGVAIPLSTGEFNLLHALVTRPRRVLSRDQLLDLSQGRELAAFERSIDNHVSRLRKKIEEDPSNPKLIKTVWGGGYMLAAEVRKI